MWKNRITEFELWCGNENYAARRLSGFIDNLHFHNTENTTGQSSYFLFVK